MSRTAGEFFASSLVLWSIVVLTQKGAKFALVETSYVLVKMLQHFDAIEPSDRVEMSRLRKSVGLTMWPADSVRVRLHRAS